MTGRLHVTPHARQRIAERFGEFSPHEAFGRARPLTKSENTRLRRYRSLKNGFLKEEADATVIAIDGETQAVLVMVRIREHAYRLVTIFPLPSHRDCDALKRRSSHQLGNN